MKAPQLIVITAIICALALPAAAQNYTNYFDEISNVNRIQPLQNPAFENADDILKRRVLDRKNKVVGEVNDVLIKNNGSIANLEVSFNRLGLDNGVYINYRSMSVRPSTNGYAINLSDDQISEVYPTLLSDIEAAAGSEGDIFSVNQVLGTEMKALDGRKIGVVEDVLFSANGGRVEALLVSLKGFNMRGKSVAVPLSMTNFEDDSNRKIVIIGDEQADAVLNYAEER